MRHVCKYGTDPRVQVSRIGSYAKSSHQTAGGSDRIGLTVQAQVLRITDPKNPAARKPKRSSRPLKRKAQIGGAPALREGAEFREMRHVSM